MNADLLLTGWGAVSPAGWSATALAEAVLSATALPVTREKRHDDAREMACQRVPAPAASPPWLRHARLRRTSPITRFAVSAALEALGTETAQDRALGIVFAVQNGGVNFSRRFYAEVLENPSLASPILFPETVFNAPSSHLASLLGAPLLNNTLVSDAGGFLVALDMAAQWLNEGRVSDCLVIAAEEFDWLSAEALALYPGAQVASEGAAALWLRRGEASADDVVLAQITNAQTHTNALPRAAAVQAMRAELAAPTSAALVSAASGSVPWDRPHEEAFADWQGARHLLQPRLGHSFSVLAGWQCVLGCELLRRGLAEDVVLPADTGATQSVAAWLQKSHGST